MFQIVSKRLGNVLYDVARNSNPKNPNGLFEMQLDLGRF